VRSVAALAAVLLGLAFVVAGASKVAAGRSWPIQAQALGAPNRLIAVVPWFEIALGAALIARLIEPLPAVAAIIVLLVFTLLIARRLAEGKHPACACFGLWSAKPIGPSHLARNFVLMTFGLIALYS
jgi:uncharacterized membrane protein YphA (DoxX/SURF4 family)